VSPFFSIRGDKRVRGGPIDGHAPKPRQLPAAARFDRFQSRAGTAVEGNTRVGDSNEAEIALRCLAIATREAQGAAAHSGSDCDVDTIVLGVGDPRASAGADRLPATSELVSARLGIDGALSLRHLYLRTFLLSGHLLPLSRSLPTSASVNSCRPAGPSAALSASRMVVVMKVSSLVLSKSFRYQRSYRF
jgi:hypothetical protein